MLTCKEASLLVSQSIDRRLSWRERWGVRAHLFICAACRRFKRHMEFLHRAAREYAAEGLRTVHRYGLSAAARDRVRQALAREL
jgi:uncharacterized protein YcgI (DUF1989 family)